MAKTRRTKQNRSPMKPYRNAWARVVNKGIRAVVQGVRGRTEVKRVTNDEGKRLTTVRVTQDLPQIIAKPVGDKQPKSVILGGVITGVARSKVYPYRSTKRGALPVPEGLMAKARNAMKRVIVSKTKPLPGLGG